MPPSRDLVLRSPYQASWCAERIGLGRSSRNIKERIMPHRLPTHQPSESSSDDSDDDVIPPLEDPAAPDVDVGGDGRGGRGVQRGGRAVRGLGGGRARAIRGGDGRGDLQGADVGFRGFGGARAVGRVGRGGFEGAAGARIRGGVRGRAAGAAAAGRGARGPARGRARGRRAPAVGGWVPGMPQPPAQVPPQDTNHIPPEVNIPQHVPAEQFFHPIPPEEVLAAEQNLPAEEQIIQAGAIGFDQDVVLIPPEGGQWEQF